MTVRLTQLGTYTGAFIASLVDVEDADRDGVLGPLVRVVPQLFLSHQQSFPAGLFGRKIPDLLPTLVTGPAGDRGPCCPRPESGPLG